jgi:hypothetical protein
MKDNTKLSDGKRKHFFFAHLVNLKQSDPFFVHEKSEFFDPVLNHEECTSISRCGPFSFWWWRRLAESSPNDVRSPEFRQMPAQQHIVSVSRGTNEPATELATK